MNDSAPQGGQNKMSKNLIIGALILIVLFLLFSWNANKEETTSQSGNDDTTQEATEGGAVEPSTVNIDGIMPDTWELHSRAQNGINTLTSGQEINAYIIQDPTDENVVYFSAHSFDDGDGLMQVGVYRYRTDNYHFERLFRRSYDSGTIDGLPTTEFPVFHVVGYDDGRLILLVQSESDTNDVCAQPLLLADEGERVLWSINIEDPYGGLEEYVLSTQMREQAQQIQDDCLTEME